MNESDPVAMEKARAFARGGDVSDFHGRYIGFLAGYAAATEDARNAVASQLSAIRLMDNQPLVERRTVSRSVRD